MLCNVLRATGDGNSNDCDRDAATGGISCNYDKAPAAHIAGGAFAACYNACKADCQHCCADFRRSYYRRDQAGAGGILGHANSTTNACFDRCHRDFDCEGVVCANASEVCTSTGVVDGNRGLCAQNYTCAVPMRATDAAPIATTVAPIATTAIDIPTTATQMPLQPNASVRGGPTARPAPGAVDEQGDAMPGVDGGSAHEERASEESGGGGGGGDGDGGGQIAGVVTGVLLAVGLLGVGACLWVKKTTGPAQNTAAAAFADAEDRRNTVDMVANPLARSSHGGAGGAGAGDASGLGGSNSGDATDTGSMVAEVPSDVYYSSIRPSMQNDEDGYVVDESYTGGNNQDTRPSMQNDEDGYVVDESCARGGNQDNGRDRIVYAIPLSSDAIQGSDDTNANARVYAVPNEDARDVQLYQPSPALHGAADGGAASYATLNDHAAHLYQVPMDSGGVFYASRDQAYNAGDAYAPTSGSAERESVL